MSQSNQPESIARDELLEGAILINTVRLPHLGLPEEISESGKSYHYESLVVVEEDWSGAEQIVYVSEEAAEEGHRILVDRWNDAKPAYCFDCVSLNAEEAKSGWILPDGGQYCAGSKEAQLPHRMCSECLPAYHCDQHPNWCPECEPSEFCELHRTDEQ